MRRGNKERGLKEHKEREREREREKGGKVGKKDRSERILRVER